ncbi:MAG: TldD/PmbA family protein [Bdellovibrionales bacterium]|nr:TldD/PmbA family protein [Bdellovibrionales bacterium]
MNYLELLKSQTQNLKLDCEYWDVRIESVIETTIDLVDGEIVTCSASPSSGAFIRVRKDGFWFYESTTKLNRINESLHQLASQQSKTNFLYKYVPGKQTKFSKILYGTTNFSLVSLNKKLNLVKLYSEVMKREPFLISYQTSYNDTYKVKAFVNSVGTEFVYDFNQAGIALRYTLKKEEAIFDDKISFYASDFSELEGKEEVIRSNLLESKEFLDAPSVKPGKYKVLFDPELTGVFTHESFGHKSEADFMLGDLKALEDWKLGSMIAVSGLTIVDCGIHEKTSGYCPIDDDGVLAKKNYLIKNGVLSSRLHSIDTAIQLNEKPTGNSRSMSFEFEPIVRMTSTYIEAGNESLDNILKKSEGAILVKGAKHGSGLSTFTIAPNRGYLIEKNGKKKPIRVSVVSGSVFETLKNIELISSDVELHSSAIGGCGKMKQWPLPVSAGGPYILVKDMQVS